MNTIKRLVLSKLESTQREGLLKYLTGNYKFLSIDWIKQKYWYLLTCILSSKELFSLIYARNLWGNDESVSGPGSTLHATNKIRDTLPRLFNRLEIKSILDIPCGDFNWMKHIALGNIHYLGADIVPELIEKNQQLYRTKNRDFITLDIITDKLPKVDIVFCRDCLVHLKNQDVIKALSNIKNSGTTYLLTTQFPDHKTNSELSTDYWRPINLEEKPFSLPPPILSILEGHYEPGYADKSLGLWKIENLHFF
ncbi:MAG: class I SAM-dependent methyltransferase [Bacteroidota bacterium]|nr:class I SAM-dependent methyltransferase [Bacteroidota bacterium]